MFRFIGCLVKIMVRRISACVKALLNLIKIIIFPETVLDQIDDIINLQRFEIFQNDIRFIPDFHDHEPDLFSQVDHFVPVTDS